MSTYAQLDEPIASTSTVFYTDGWQEDDGTIFEVETLAAYRDSYDFLIKAFDFTHDVYYATTREYPRKQVVEREWSMEQLLTDLDDYARGEFRDGYYTYRLKEYGF